MKEIRVDGVEFSQQEGPNKEQIRAKLKEITLEDDLRIEAEMLEDNMKIL